VRERVGERVGGGEEKQTVANDTKEGMVSEQESQNSIRAGLLVSELQEGKGEQTHVQLTIVGGG